jgi:YHYH protein
LNILYRVNDFLFSFRRVLMLGFLLCFTACPTTPSTKTPVISSFTATPNSIVSGGSSSLNWTVMGDGVTLSIDQGVGTVTGSSRVVSPTITTTYVLTAQNSAGTVTQPVTVTVTPATPGLPVISSFTATPSSINAGSSSNLAWTVTGSGVTLSLDQGIGVVTGTSKTVTPASTLIYVLSAQNAGGTVTKAVTVTVTPVASNQAPTVSSIPDVVVSQGAASQNIDLKTKFNDAEDGTNLTYSASSSNSSIVSTNVTNGVMALTFGAAGTASVTTTGKDSGNLSVSTSFNVTVNAVVSASPCDNFLKVTANAINKQKGYPDPSLSATCSNSSFVVASNGIPNFEFVMSNPSDLKAQTYSFSIPRNPSFALSTTAVPLGGPIGITINGLPLFGPTENPMDGYKDPYLNGILDYCNGHPAQQGDYHFHALPTNALCIADIKKVGQVLGYAFDGYAMVSPYVCTDAACTTTKKLTSSWRVIAGKDPKTSNSWDAHEFVSGLGDLDACNGYTRADGSYVYVATDAFPYFIGCYKGTPIIPAPPR